MSNTGQGAEQSNFNAGMKDFDDDPLCPVDRYVKMS